MYIVSLSLIKRQFTSVKLPLITLLIASTVNAREMNKAKISSVDLSNSVKTSNDIIKD